MTDASGNINDSSKRKRWLIVGGGVLGLRLADLLLDAQQDVTIFEAAPTLGGLASPWKISDLQWDRFYHVTLLSDSRLRAVLKTLDLDDQMQWVTTRTGFYCDGELVSLSNSWEFLKFPPLKLIDKFRLGATISLAARIKDWRRLEQIPIEQWLIKLSGRRVYERMWLPLLKAKLGSSHDRVSAAFIWAYIARMYKARRSGMKTELFGYAPGGYAEVLQRWQRLLEERGARVCTQHAVKRVASTCIDSTTTREQLEVSYSVQQSELQQTRPFDRVICTLPSPTIADLCPQLNESEQRCLRNIKYLGVRCLSLVLERPLSPYYVTNITDDWVPMTGIIEMTNVVGPDQFAGKTLVYLPKYLPADDEAFDEPESKYREECIAALERMHPHFHRDQVIAAKLASARQVMAIPTLNYSQNLPPIRTSVAGFIALNSAHITEGTLNVNETLELAEKKFQSEIAPSLS